MIGKTLPKECEQFLKEKGSGDDRRSGIMFVTVVLVDLGAASQGGATIQQGDLVAFCAETQRGSDAAVSGTQNERAFGCRMVRWAVIRVDHGASAQVLEVKHPIHRGALRCQELPHQDAGVRMHAPLREQR